ncbi:MAG TPA: SRPBCC family protein [Gemmataceae bacterium]|nr:SRPBCC family protein [Gemmataceae bacterium]
MSLTLNEKLRAFDPTLPLERARTMPAAWYFDPEIYAAERERVFGRSWLAAARADQLTKPGSFVTADIAGEPILVLRDQDGVLRAFHNVCRHRAARVMTEAEGCATRLRCPYHGWTYDLCGRLRGTPEFEGVADFRREDNGLVPLAVEAWGPLVFVRATSLSPPTPLSRGGGEAGKTAVQLESFLAPLPERTASLGIEKLRFVERREYELACNWKVFVDNYLDGGYHVNYVHPGLSGVLDYSQYRSEIFASTSVQSSPIKAAEDAEVSVRKVRSGDRAYYWWVFPNLMINLYQGVMDTNLVLPLGPERCKVIFDFYFAETEGEAAKRYIADSIAVAHQIQLEDVGISEDVQKGLASRSYDMGRFSVRREIAGYHFHRLLAARLTAESR